MSSFIAQPRFLSLEKNVQKIYRFLVTKDAHFSSERKNVERKINLHFVGFYQDV